MGPAIDRMAIRSILLVGLCLTSLALGLSTKCPRQKTSPGREVICYTSKSDVKLLEDSICRCTTLVHQGHNIHNLSVSDFQDFSKDLKELYPPLQFVISVYDPAGTLKTSGTSRQAAAARLAGILNEVDGVELNVTAGSKERLYHFVKGLKDEMVRKSIDRRILMALPTKPEDLAKQFDLKELSKYVDLFTIATHYLVDDDEIYHTFHPSRMIGLFDMLNTDSLVDLISGLGAPKRKLLISMPASAYKFNLKSETENAPRSRTEDEYPVVIDRKEFCESIDDDDWTIERDEDLTAPYAFKNKTWIAFEDKISAGIKGKYVMLRDLAGLGIWDIENDLNSNCGKPISHEVHHSFMDFKRKSRHAVLTSLEDDLHQALITYPNKAKSSGYRVVRVVDTEGHIRAVRENTQTEFTCTRQGYFVHPKSCNRFYRCVKFNQGIENYSVFEFDCPAGLAFDERTEVCVWPGSLPQGSPCPGSSEVAPAPQVRFQCPPEPGYYADQRNCRWFFACMDLGGPELMAFEFRCPYDLVFDQEKLVCEWPWLVPSCSSSGSGYTRTEYDFHGGVGSTQGGGKFVTGGIPAGFSGTTGSGYYGSTGGQQASSGGTRFTGSSTSGQFDQHSGQFGSHTDYSGVTGGYSTGSGYAGGSTGYVSVAGGQGSSIGGQGSSIGGYSTGSGYAGGSTGYVTVAGGQGSSIGGQGSSIGGQGSSIGGYSTGSGYTGGSTGYISVAGGQGSSIGGQGSSIGGYSTGSGYTGGSTGYISVAGGQGSSIGGQGSSIGGQGSSIGGYSTGSGYTGGSTGYVSVAGGQGSSIGGQYTGGATGGYKGSTDTGYFGGHTASGGSGYSGSSKNVYQGSTIGVHGGASGATTYTKAGVSVGTGYSQSTDGSYHGSGGAGQAGGSIGGGYSISTNGVGSSQYSGSSVTGSGYSGSSSTGYRGGSGATGSGVGYTGSVGLGTQGFNEHKGSGGYSDGTYYSGTTKGGQGQYTVSSSGGYAGSSDAGYSQGSSFGVGHGATVDYSGSTGSIYTGSKDGSGAVDYSGSTGSIYAGSKDGSGAVDYSGSTGSIYTGSKDATQGYSSHSVQGSGSTDSGYSGSGFPTKTTYTGSFGVGHAGGSSNVFTGTTSIGSKYPGGSQDSGYGTKFAQGHGSSSTQYYGGSKSEDIPGYTIPVAIVPGEFPYSQDGGVTSGTHTGGISKGVGSGSTSSVYTKYQGKTDGYVTDHSGSTGSIYSGHSGHPGIQTTYTGDIGATGSFGQGGYSGHGSVPESNLNITLVLGGTPTPSTVYQRPGYSGGSYNIGQGSTGTIVTGSSIDGAIITDDSISGTVLTHGDASGSVSTGGAHQGTVITGSSQPGYVHTQTGTPGYVVTGGVKTVYPGSASPGTYVHGSVQPGVTLTGTPAPGVILHGQSSPGVHLTGQTSSGVVVGGTVREGTTVGDSIGSHFYTDSGATVYGGSGGSGNVGVVTPSTTENTSYKTNEYHDNGGRGTIKFNNGLVTTKYTESDLTDYRTSIGTLPDKVVPGGRLDGVRGSTGSSVYSSTQSSSFNQNGFTKTGPTKTGYVTATLGGRGSYVVSNGQTRPTTNYDNIGANAFDGNVAGFPKTSKGPSNVVTSTGGSDGTHIDTSKLTLGPAVSYSGSSIYGSGIQSSTSVPSIGRVPVTVTTPSYSDTGIYQSPTYVDSGSVTPTPSGANVYTYNGHSYSSGNIPSTVSTGLFTTGPLEIYKNTMFGAAGISSPVSTVHPVIDNGYKTIISSTPIPVTLTDDRYSYKDSRFHTGSLSTQAQSALDTGVSFQQTGLYNKTDHISVTTSLPSVSVSSGYISSKSRPSGTYKQTTLQPEGQYLPSSTPAPVSGGFNGYTYTKAEIPFEETGTPSTVTYQQPTGSIHTQYLPSTTTSPSFGVTYTKPFSIPGVTYEQSTPGYVSSIGGTSGHGYSTKTKTTFGSSTSFGGSPTNVGISRDKVGTLVNNYDRGAVKYTPSVHDTYTGTVGVTSTGSAYDSGYTRKQQSSFSSSSGGQNYVGSTRTQSTPAVTTYSGGYTRVSSVTPSYEVSTKTASKGKIIVKWSDLHPLLLGKLGAECTCKGDPFANLRGPGKKLIDSSKGQVDLANYDDSEVYVDLENEDSGDYDYVTNYESSSSRPYKIDPYENKGISGATDKVSSIKIGSRPSSTYLPGGSTSVTNSYSLGVRSGKKLDQVSSTRNSLSESSSLSFSTGNINVSDEILEGPNDCARPGLFRHPNFCNKFYACHWDEWKKSFTLHVFNCPVHLTFDSTASACNWPSKGPACQDDNLLV